MACRSEFATDKARVLGQVDLSRKGSVDEPIAPLVEYLNSLENYYTTSSCSGRISAFSQESTLRKKGCQWLLISHGFIELSQLMSLGSKLPASGYVYFKFEPFVLHVMCRTLQDAQALLQLATGSGFRNSGITCGKKERIMVAVRSTHSLEAPIACNGDMIVSKEYLKHLVEIGNKKLSDNLQRVDRFFHQVKETLSKNAISLPTTVTDPGNEQKRTQPMKPFSSHRSGKGTRTENASSGSAGIFGESDADNPEEILAQLFGNTV